MIESNESLAFRGATTDELKHAVLLRGRPAHTVSAGECRNAPNLLMAGKLGYLRGRD